MRKNDTLQNRPQLYDEIGCPLASLWQRGLLTEGRTFTTARCTIARIMVYRKRNRNIRTPKQQ